MKAKLALIAAAAVLASPVAVLAAKAKAKAPAPPVVAPAPTAAAPAPGDWRVVDPQNLLVIDTNKGRVLVEMTPEAAPAHVAQVRALALKHFYDGQTFFRVIEDFMDQTGDPKNKGDGNSDLPNIKAEFTFRRTIDTPFVKVASPSGSWVGFVGALPVQTQPDGLMAMTQDGKVAAWGLYCPGVAGMARDEGVDSANSQFFLMRASYPSLEKRYTAWGRALGGLDVIRAIKVGEPVADPQDRMITVRLAADMSELQRPKVSVLNTRSAAFRVIVEKTRTARAADFSICDIEVPVQVK